MVLGRSCGATENGPVGSNNHFIALRIVAEEAIGMISEKANPAALPALAPAAIRSRSMTVTENPS